MSDFEVVDGDEYQDPWGDEATDLLQHDGEIASREWLRMSKQFVNAGYREGISAGKDSTLQEGFDAGFAEVGAPLGRKLGVLRGLAAGLSSVLSSSATSAEGSDSYEELTSDVLQIVQELGRIRFPDIEPPDLEADSHIREHLEAKGEIADANEEIKGSRDVTDLEEALEALSASSDSTTSKPITKPGIQELKEIQKRLQIALEQRDFGHLSQD